MVSDKRFTYLCQVSYYEPASGTLAVPAKDEEHARELLTAMMVHVKDLKIYDVARQDGMQMPNTTPMDGMGNPPTPSIN